MKLATLCYIVKDEKVLMLHRIKKQNDFHEGKWNGLGGKFEAGETPEECAKREVFEESGLIAQKMQWKGMISFPMFDMVEDWYAFVYRIEEYSGEMTDSNEGVLKWIPQNSLMELNLWPGDRIFLPWVFQEKFFSAKFVYEQKQFISHEVIFYP